MPEGSGLGGDHWEVSMTWTREAYSTPPTAGGEARAKAATRIPPGLIAARVEGTFRSWIVAPAWRTKGEPAPGTELGLRTPSPTGAEIEVARAGMGPAA